MSSHEYRVANLDVTVPFADMFVVQCLVPCQLVSRVLGGRLAELCGALQQLVPKLVLALLRMGHEGRLSGPYIWTWVPGGRQLYRGVSSCRMYRRVLGNAC
jgi:hypothetical protein